MLKLPEIGQGRNRPLQNSVSAQDVNKRNIKKFGEFRSKVESEKGLKSKQLGDPKKKIESDKGTKSKWQLKSEQFRAAMRAGRNEKDSGADSKDNFSLGTEPLDDGRTKCPHCRRKFNPEPFKRHVDICP